MEEEEQVGREEDAPAGRKVDKQEHWLVVEQETKETDTLIDKQKGRQKDKQPSTEARKQTNNGSKQTKRETNRQWKPTDGETNRQGKQADG